MRLGGLGLASILTVILGLAFIVAGLALGAVDGDTLGGMVGMSVGIEAIAVAFMFRPE